MTDLVEEGRQAARANAQRLKRELPKRLRDLEDQTPEVVRSAAGTLFEKLEILYRRMDELYTFVAGYTPCKVGCCFCCHYPVSISDLEVADIECRTGARRQVSLARVSSLRNTPCPFLFASTCSIYDQRPFLCRRHVTLRNNAYWCHPERCNQTEFPMLRFTRIDEAYAWLVRESGGITYPEIRDVFPLGLGTA